MTSIAFKWLRGLDWRRGVLGSRYAAAMGTRGTFEWVEEFKSSHEEYLVSEKVRY